MVRYDHILYLIRYVSYSMLTLFKYGNDHGMTNYMDLAPDSDRFPAFRRLRMELASASDVGILSAGVFRMDTPS